MLSIDEVREYAMSLPEASEVVHWGKPSFRVNNKIFTVIQEDGSTITVKTSREEREMLTVMDPAAYAVPESFANLNYMHVRLEQADPQEVKDLILKGWASVAPKKRVKSFMNPEQG